MDIIMLPRVFQLICVLAIMAMWGKLQSLDANNEFATTLGVALISGILIAVRVILAMEHLN